jgi:dihydroorotate dehydrogenase (NAD+) catalytic subunit
MAEPNLTVRIAGMELKNPVLLASGTARYGEEISSHLDLNKVGGIMVKGIALRPTPGNPPVRICETPAGMLNAIGLPNVGADEFIREKLPFLRRFDTKVIVNIFGSTVEDYAEVARRFDGVEGIHGLELNISCPNIKEGGSCFGMEVKATYEVVSAVRRATRLPLIVKLSPNVTDIVAFARASKDAGGDALSLVNTFLGMAIDTETWKPKLANMTGGLSGPAIRPLAVRMVWQVAQSGVNLPIIGMGGIMTAEDAVEFLLAGADAVAVGTANFLRPDASADIIDGLGKYMEKKGIRNIRQMVGAVVR